ncbi:MAG: leucine-rich repeat domain-containing protein [Erysipelotrichales bacterium]|nr:leucine-rich repeat domain-containing protein [Erysipelotrichales bacterium]
MRSIEFESNSRLRAIVSGGDVLGGSFGERPEGAFENSGLESIVLPRSLEWIGRRAFSQTKNLIKVDFEPNSELYSIDRGAFVGSSLEWIRFPASLRMIGMYAFIGTNLKEIHQEKGSNLEMISSLAFRDVESLSSFIIPISVTYVSSFAFYGWGSHQTIYVEGRSELRGVVVVNHNATIVWNWSASTQI